MSPPGGNTGCAMGGAMKSLELVLYRLGRCSDGVRDSVAVPIATRGPSPLPKFCQVCHKIFSKMHLKPKFTCRVNMISITVFEKYSSM